MKKTWIIFIFFCSFFACEKHQNENNIGNGLTLELPVDSLSSNYNQLYQVVEGNEGTMIYVTNTFINGLDIYSMDNKALKGRISVPRDGPGSLADIKGFHVFNEDSILFFSDKSINGLFYVRGKPAKKVADFINIEGRIVNHHISSTTPILEFEGKLFIYALPFNRDANISPYQDLDIILDFNNNKITQVFSNIKFEDLSKWGALRFPTRCLNPINRSVVYSYPFSDELMIYNIDTEKYTYQNLSSANFEHVTYTRENFTSESAFYLENNYYDAILFDPFRQKYYRFARMSINNKNTLGKTNSIYNQPVSIVVAGLDFQKLGERILKPAENYLVKDFIISPTGLMISNCNPENKNLKEDFISFSLIDLPN